MFLVYVLLMDFHCILQLQDRSRNVNGTFISGWIMSLPVTILEGVSQNCFALRVFNMHFGRKSRKKKSFCAKKRF